MEEETEPGGGRGLLLFLRFVEDMLPGVAEPGVFSLETVERGSEEEGRKGPGVPGVVLPCRD